MQTVDPAAAPFRPWRRPARRMRDVIQRMRNRHLDVTGVSPVIPPVARRRRRALPVAVALGVGGAVIGVTALVRCRANRSILSALAGRWQ